MASKKQMSTREAIVKVLTDAGKPMSVPEIIKAGLPLAKGLKGKTPGQTFYSILYAENKKADGIVKRTNKPGMFKLNPKARTVGERKSNGSATTVKPDPKPSQRRTRSRAAAAA